MGKVLSIFYFLDMTFYMCSNGRHETRYPDTHDAEMPPMWIRLVSEGD